MTINIKATQAPSVTVFHEQVDGIPTGAFYFNAFNQQIKISAEEIARLVEYLQS